MFVKSLKNSTPPPPEKVKLSTIEQTLLCIESFLTSAFYLADFYFTSFHKGEVR